ncbi:HDOD domain-containing protein [Pelagicoccus albus]|uniref:HDOD domain-containing protein n=1 Tax=Pelagicoccus albus TaxID=415222 RepID=A0A7X1BA51_9BACT|nr:HDOD domain-containing protein [Pelagicoccus albus]MBC2607155.1 HDOD domain-containing protein [Pelagicoccus albus]
MNRKIEYGKYLEYVSGLFPMPRIMAEVARRLKDEDTIIGDLADLIRSDASLVGGIVRLSNSSYYGFSEKTDSLDDAMQRIGLREIARLVGVCTVCKVYQDELDSYRIPPEVFWESSIAVALLMERFAAYREMDTEAAYLSGLMRECGMLVINYALKAEGRTERWDHLEPVHEWEYHSFGLDHMEVGGQLLKLWGFDEDICKIVEEQWVKNSTEMGKLLDLANAVVARCGCDFGNHCGNFEPCEERVSAAGMSLEDFTTAVDSAREAFDKLKAGIL